MVRHELYPDPERQALRMVRNMVSELEARYMPHPDTRPVSKDIGGRFLFFATGGEALTLKVKFLDADRRQHYELSYVRLGDPAAPGESLNKLVDLDDSEQPITAQDVADLQVAEMELSTLLEAETSG